MKIRPIILGTIIIFLASCGYKLTTENTASIIKETFYLTDKDKVEILGISKESEDTALVKFKINDDEFRSKFRKYNKGWQLDEIQTDLGIWAPTSSTIYHFIITRVMIDMNKIATAIMDYVADHGKAPNQEGAYDENSPFYKAISNYLSKPPIKNPWGHSYYVFCGKAIRGKYGIKDANDDDFLVTCYGKDGLQDTWMFNPLNLDEGLFSHEDYDNDLIIYNGDWIRGPKWILEKYLIKR